MQPDKTCSISVNILYEAAFRLYSYNNFPLAQVLLHSILEEHAEYEPAQTLYETITGNVHQSTALKNPRLSYDYQKKKYVLRDSSSGSEYFFQTYQEADAFYRGVK